MPARHVTVPVLLLALAAPATAQGATGGAEFVPEFRTASDGAVSIQTRPGGLLGVRKTVTGQISRRGAGRMVTLERYDELARAWSPIAGDRTSRDGSFRARWKPDRIGPQRLRVRVVSRKARLSRSAPELEITLYRSARATWYGPGFFGNRTACGLELTRELEGVAHRRLPCGTPVEILFRGRSVTVPVVDRGPFANGADYDLTAATAELLGFDGVRRIGALPQERRRR